MSKTWQSVSVVAVIYVAWVLYMFRNPGPDDFFRETLQIALTAPGSFIVRGLAEKYHFAVPSYVLPFANVLLMLGPFLIFEAIRAVARHRRAR